MKFHDTCQPFIEEIYCASRMKFQANVFIFPWIESKTGSEILESDFASRNNKGFIPTFQELIIYGIVIHIKSQLLKGRK